MIFQAQATGYYPVLEDDPNYKMEGGKVDRLGNPIFTLDQFKRGEADFVTLAMDSTALPYGTMLTSPEFPGVPFKVADTGSAFKGKGLSRVDIPRDTAAGANSNEINRQFTFELAGMPSGDAKIVPQQATSIPNLEIGPQIPEIELPADYQGQTGQSSLAGVDFLTPIGTEEPAIEMPQGLGVEPPIEEAQSTVSPEVATADIPHPSSKDAKPVKRNADGSVLFDTGVTWYPDGRIEWDVAEGAARAIKSGPHAKTIIRNKSIAKPEKFKDIDGRQWERESPKGEWKESTPEGAMTGRKPTAIVSTRATEGINAIRGLEELLVERKKKPEVGWSEKAALVKQSTPAAGFFDSIGRQTAQAFVSKDAVELEALRNRVNALIIFARGGTALTPTEKQALTIVEPDDTKEAAITKIETTLPLIKRELGTLSAQYPGAFPEIDKALKATPASSQESAPSATPTPAATPVAQEQTYIEWAKQHPDDTRAQIILRHAGQ